MEVYFENDGTYGQSAVKTPVIVNGKPIGFICEVTEEIVTCYLWDKFIQKEQLGFNAFSREQDILSINIEC